jgi:hypothetical protein
MLTLEELARSSFTGTIQGAGLVDIRTNDFTSDITMTTQQGREALERSGADQDITERTIVAVFGTKVGERDFKEALVVNESTLGNRTYFPFTKARELNKEILTGMPLAAIIKAARFQEREQSPAHS